MRHLIYQNEAGKSDGANGSGGSGASPGLPDILVGTEDRDSGPQGKRYTNGPLSPQFGGTGDAQKDYDKLAGGRWTEQPDGMRIGENGIRYRPGTGPDGPRIDIPSNGMKPHETLHYDK